MESKDIKKAAKMLNEFAYGLWCKYKTYRYGQPWDNTMARRQYYETRRLAHGLTQLAETMKQKATLRKD